VVVLEIVETEIVRIRGGWEEADGEKKWKGSMARIVPKGLLGDMQMEVTKGEGELLAPGSEIPGEPMRDMMGAISGLAGEAEQAISNVGEITEQLKDERLHKDIREAAAGMNVLLEQLTAGEGYPHRFLTDPQESERISRAIASFEQTSTELNHTLREVRLTAARVRTGPGFAHDVIYGDGPKKEIGQFGMAAEEVAITLKGIREGNGFAHDVLFGGDENTDDAMKNVNQLTADLRDIVRDMKDGKGTIGALLVDPSIYEDVKRLLGNVGRNNVLRALVRYSIKKDGKEPVIEVDGGGSE
jgi:phospholipid/cholesterol/gamma-HCH transport system substrate-binding protein